VLHPVFVKRTLVAASAVLAVLLVAGCSDDPEETSPTPSASASPSAPVETQGPTAATEDPSAGGPTTIDADDVTAAQKKACLDAMVEQLRAKKGGTMPQECAMLPSDVIRELVGKALNGG
jgi:hypothetical protein